MHQLTLALLALQQIAGIITLISTIIILPSLGVASVFTHPVIVSLVESILIAPVILVLIANAV